MRVLGENETLNQSLEKAGRVADFLEFGELLCRDALHRKESCGGHFREEYQTEEGEALRDDENFAYVAAWEFTGVGAEPDAAQGAARVRVRPPRDRGRTSRGPIEHETTMRITLTVWRQAGPDAPGAFETYDVAGVSPDMSFLEMLDVVNERLIADGKEPIAFDHDCREGICGSCGMMINGVPARSRARHRDVPAAHAQVPRRRPHHGRAVARGGFPLVKDLVVDRSAFDRIIEAGGYITAPTGGAPDAQPHPDPEGGRRRGDGRGRVHRLRRVRGRVPERRRAAVHRRRSSQHLNLMPQGQAERWDRTRRRWSRRWSVLRLVHEPPASARPRARRRSRIDFIALMNRDYVKAQLKQRRLLAAEAPDDQHGLTPCQSVGVVPRSTSRLRNVWLSHSAAILPAKSAVSAKVVVGLSRFVRRELDDHQEGVRGCRGPGSSSARVAVRLPAVAACHSLSNFCTSSIFDVFISMIWTNPIASAPRSLVGH